MRCYRLVNNAIEPGLLVHMGDRGPAVRLGEGQNFKYIPLRGFDEQIEELGCTQQGQQLTLPNGRPLVLMEAHLLHAMKDKPAVFVPHREDRPTQIVCLHVCVPPGIGGTAKYSAATYREEDTGQFVRRVYGEGEFPPPGVRIEFLAELSYKESTWQDMILRMKPGASFRIERSGELGDEPEGYVVTYNRELKVTSFRMRKPIGVSPKYKKRKEEKEPEAVQPTSSEDVA